MTRRRTKLASLHRQVLAQAWARTWSRKRVWVFAWPAAILSTGGAFEVAVRAFERIEQGQDLVANALAGSLPGASILQAGVRILAGIPPARAALGLAAIALFALALLVLAACAQAALIHGVSQKEGKTFATHWSKGCVHVWSLLEIALVAKCAIALVAALAAIPLFLFVQDPSLASGLVFSVILLAFFPLIIMIASVALLAAVRAVKTGEHGPEAIRKAWQLFRAHEASAFELGLLLFCVMFGTGLASTALIVLGAIPFAAAAAFTLLAGAPYAFAAAQMIGLVVILAAILFGGAGAVTFQYAAWAAFYEKISHPLAPKRVVSKLRRVWNAL